MPLVAANWKMNPTNIDDALDLARGILSVARGHAERVEVVIVPPFPWLIGISEVLESSGVKLGAQDCFWEMSGAYTGEVSPAMLKGMCQWVIVGHSERRLYLGETDDMVAKKTSSALSSELGVIMCVGELADHYDAGTSDEVVSAQVKAGLASPSGGLRPPPPHEWGGALCGGLSAPLDRTPSAPPAGSARHLPTSGEDPSLVEVVSHR